LKKSALVPRHSERRPTLADDDLRLWLEYPWSRIDLYHEPLRPYPNVLVEADARLGPCCGYALPSFVYLLNESFLQPTGFSFVKFPRQHRRLNGMDDASGGFLNAIFGCIVFVCVWGRLTAPHQFLYRYASASLPLWSLHVIVHGGKPSGPGRMALGRIMLQPMGLRWRWLLYGIR
jgi:hypothetical protein